MKDVLWNTSFEHRNRLETAKCYNVVGCTFNLNLEKVPPQWYQNPDFDQLKLKSLHKS